MCHWHSLLPLSPKLTWTFEELPMSPASGQQRVGPRALLLTFPSSELLSAKCPHTRGNPTAENVLWNLIFNKMPYREWKCGLASWPRWFPWKKDNRLPAVLMEAKGWREEIGPGWWSLKIRPEFRNFLTWTRARVCMSVTSKQVCAMWGGSGPLRMGPSHSPASPVGNTERAARSKNRTISPGRLIRSEQLLLLSDLLTLSVSSVVTLLQRASQKVTSLFDLGLRMMIKEYLHCCGSL